MLQIDKEGQIYHDLRKSLEQEWADFTFHLINNCNADVQKMAKHFRAIKKKIAEDKDKGKDND